MFEHSSIYNSEMSWAIEFPMNLCYYSPDARLSILQGKSGSFGWKKKKKLILEERRGVRAKKKREKNCKIIKAKGNPPNMGEPK